MMSGTSFNRKANSIAIGTVQNALVNVPSKDGKTLAFRLPSTLCNQKTKANCPKIVTSPGTYNITVSNINGVSNAMPFQILPLAPLALTTDILPQTPTGARYEAPVEAVGGAESYQWRVSEGTLPPGLKLTQASCKETPCRTSALVRGIPTVPGTYQFEISLNSGSETVSRRFTITVVLGLSNPF